MMSLYILLPIAVIFFFLIVAILAWSILGKQYDDLDTPSLRLLFDKDYVESDPPPTIQQ